MNGTHTTASENNVLPHQETNLQDIQRDRRRISFGSSRSPTNKYSSIESGMSYASDIYENIDLDETEQNMKDVDTLIEQTRIYTTKIDTSEKNLEKRK